MPNCPVCSKSMYHDKRGEVEIDVCARHGIWLDKKELYQITEDARRDEDIAFWEDWFRTAVSTPTDHDRKLECPICNESMTLEKYEGVVIDYCTEHGTWLDSGELDAILSNLRLDPGYLRGVALRLKDLRY